MKKLFFITAAYLAIAIAGTAYATSSVVTTTPSSKTTTTTTKNADGTTSKTTYYVDYDTNNNGILDSKEFYSYTYKYWDYNRDGYISDAEWKAGTTRWYGSSDVEYKTYTYWDKNGDGQVDSTEFDTVASNTKLYSKWDLNADGYIDNDEYAAASFNIRDLNSDGSLSMTEWKSTL